MRNIEFIRQRYLFYVEGYAKGKRPVSPMPDETGTTKGNQLVSQMEPAGFKDMVSLLIQIPWGHNVRIVQKCDTVEQAYFYVCKTIENGWSRTALIHQIDSGLYIKAIDEKLREDEDNATIGILLCKSKDKLVAEYALSDINKPMGVSAYQLTQALPASLKSSLPSIEDIEAELMSRDKL